MSMQKFSSIGDLSNVGLSKVVTTVTAKFKRADVIGSDQFMNM